MKKGKVMNLEKIITRKNNKEKMKQEPAKTIPNIDYQLKYITDVYWKDFKHLRPQAAKVFKSHIQLEFTDKPKLEKLTCRNIITLWLTEVLKGLKKFLYEGSLHGIK